MEIEILIEMLEEKGIINRKEYEKRKREKEVKLSVNLCRVFSEIDFEKLKESIEKDNRIRKGMI